MEAKVKRRVDRFVSAVVKGSDDGTIPVLSMFSSRQLGLLEDELQRGLTLGEVTEAANYFRQQLIKRQPQ